MASTRPVRFDDLGRLGGGRRRNRKRREHVIGLLVELLDEHTHGAQPLHGVELVRKLPEHGRIELLVIGLVELLDVGRPLGRAKRPERLPVMQAGSRSAT